MSSEENRSFRRRWPVPLALLIAVVGLGIAGTLLQAIATAIDYRKYRAPGRLVDVGGHHIHLHVTGEDRGGPTVILEAGLMNSSNQWAWVQPEVAQWSRVISYDRAGLGWSERSRNPRDGEQIAHELHSALEIAGIEGPYVLVGHSLGGLFMRIFASLYPDDVVGIVLVESVHPDQIQPQTPGRQRYEDYGRLMRRQLALSRFGLLRLTNLATPVSPDLPPEKQAEMRAFYVSTRHLAAAVDEWNAWDQLTSAQARRVTTIGDKPLIVLTAGANNRPDWRGLQSYLLSLSTQSTHRVLEGATHDGILTNREHATVVASVIREVVEGPAQR